MTEIPVGTLLKARQQSLRIEIDLQIQYIIYPLTYSIVPVLGLGEGCFQPPSLSHVHALRRRINQTAPTGAFSTRQHTTEALFQP